MNRWLSYAMMLMLFLLLISGAFRPDPGSRLARPAPGFPAPDFTLIDIEGNQVQLSDFRGRTLFINFWATWCPPCRAEMPEIQKLHEQIPDLVVLGINQGNQDLPPNGVAAYMKANGYTWTVPYDGDGRVSSAYGVISIPTSFVVDPEGIIRAKHIGPISLPFMKDMVGNAQTGR